MNGKHIRSERDSVREIERERVWEREGERDGGGGGYWQFSNYEEN